MLNLPWHSGIKLAGNTLDNPQGHNYHTDESTIVLLVYQNKSFIYIYFIYLAVF